MALNAHQAGQIALPIHETLIRDSWQRCRERHRLEPDLVPQPQVLSHSELKLVRAKTEDLSALAAGELDRMITQLGDHVQLLMLANPDGTLIDLRVDPQLESICRSAFIFPGAQFTEKSQGTNGIGLCIQTKSPVSVVMDEHFSHRLSGLSCTVAPIFGHRGELAAVLNITSLKPSNRTVHQIARAIVESSARRIENRSFDLRCAGRLILRLSNSPDFCDPAGEARIAIDDSGVLLDATPSAFKMVGIDAGAFGKRIEGLDDIDLLFRLLKEPRPVVHLGSSQFNIQLASTSKTSHPTNRKVLYKADSRTHSSNQTPDSQLVSIESIAGSDPDTLEKIRIARLLYQSRLPILVQGESGTGKTLLARALHDSGPNRHGNFVAINCAAIPAELIESELFGYAPGAFTGASRNGSSGRLLQADGGTLFLDEIGDMPLALQSRFLQVLSEKEFVPVGSTRPVRVNFCLVAASLRNIERMVKEKNFREDLYYRICGAALNLQPLRNRKDLSRLIESIFYQTANEMGFSAPRLESSARAMLLDYHWPGNIRELQHVARYAIALFDGSVLGPDCLPSHFQNNNFYRISGINTEHIAQPVPEQSVLLTLQRFDWNVSAAAEHLGVSRSTLHRKIRKLQLKRPSVV